MNHSWIVLLTAVTTACATRSGTTSRADATPTNGFPATAHTPASDDRNSNAEREAQPVAASSAAPASRNSVSARTGSAMENRGNASAQSVTAADQRSLGDRRGSATRAAEDTASNTLQPASGPGATSESDTGEHKKDIERDNSRANQRDRSGKSVTPIDQGGNEADRKITQQIRQAIVGDELLSFNAKNIKIITTRGKVTLRGPVKSDTERSAIDAIAKQIAGAGNVENLVEVSK